MDQATIKAIVASTIRHGLTVAAGWLAAHGWLSGDETAEFVSGGLALVAFGWSWWQKVGQAKAQADLKSAVSYWQSKGAK